VKRLLSILPLLAALSACNAPSTVPVLTHGFGLDELRDLAPSAPNAETLNGRLHYNLDAVPPTGRLIVRYKGPAGAASGGKLQPAVLESRDRRSDIRKLSANPEVAFVEPDLPVHALYASNDPDLRLQWALGKVRAPQAWELVRGDEGPLVAVLDTGVSRAHPEFTGVLVGGRDLVNGDDDADDDHGHGTHVAGIAAAAGNNAIGGAGVAPGARILPVKVLAQDGSGSTSTVVEGIRYAVAAGARVINLSLGSAFDSWALREAVQEAVAQGVVVVAAAGNNGTTTRFYPAAYPGVMAVGATTQDDARASFSNHGEWVTVAAPGQSIYGPVLGGHGYMSGTSMAAPHVAGAVALLMAANPTVTASRLKEIVATTGAPVTGFEGNGTLRRLDLYAAARSQATPPPPSPTPSPSPNPSSTPSPTPTASATVSPSPSVTPTPGRSPEAQPGKRWGPWDPSAPTAGGEGPGRSGETAAAERRAATPVTGPAPHTPAASKRPASPPGLEQPSTPPPAPRVALEGSDERAPKADKADKPDGPPEDKPASPPKGRGRAAAGPQAP
jgi:thermitase